MTVQEFLFTMTEKGIYTTEDFNDLPRKEKKIIFDLFMETDIEKRYDWDGNLMACYARIIDQKNAGLTIRFWSASATEKSFWEKIYDLEIVAMKDNGYWDDITVDKAIVYINLAKDKKRKLEIAEVLKGKSISTKDMISVAKEEVAYFWEYHEKGDLEKAQTQKDKIAGIMSVISLSFPADSSAECWDAVSTEIWNQNV